MWPAPTASSRPSSRPRLRDVVARGRAAGIIVCAATQKPSHEVIPTSLRDLFGFRWAFRCLTPQASDTILGAGWASLGYAASTIDAADRGVGLLLAEGGLPVRLRACWLDDDQLAVLAARAEALRAARPAEGSLAEGSPAEGRPEREGD
jgi:S-DNA-T family DNA segregation ATPase FtsK/SpoIIIE